MAKFPISFGWLTGFFLCSVLAGCVTLDPLTKKHETPPTGPVTQVAVTWDKTVAFVPDFTHGGAMMPGLMCRMYLFGNDGSYPLMGDGTLTVDLYDDTPLASGGQSAMKERWNIDKDTLKGVMRKDIIGWGYTLFLPWATYNPAIKQVHMMVRYTPQNGYPFFSASQTMALNHPDGNSPQTAKLGAGKTDPNATQTTRTDGTSTPWMAVRK